LEVEHDVFRITEACSQKEFEACLNADKYDLVLTDFNILDYGGFQALDRVRAVDPGLPVVIVTGTGSEEIAVEAMRRGVTDYVIKTPQHIRRLPHTIETAIEAKRLERERSRAEEKLRARIRQQAVVVELGQRALSGTDLDTVMREACILVAQTLGLVLLCARIDAGCQIALPSRGRRMGERTRRAHRLAFCGQCATLLSIEIACAYHHKGVRQSDLQ